MSLNVWSLITQESLICENSLIIVENDKVKLSLSKFVSIIMIVLPFCPTCATLHRSIKMRTHPREYGDTFLNII